MLYYLLSAGQVANVLNIMGYKVKCPAKLMEKNYDYYIKRTSHGSTLSYVVHTAILKYMPKYRKEMWKWFYQALVSDIYDIQGGTTCEGIHCGIMAGTIDIIIKTFAGINLFKDYIKLDPSLPKYWRSLSFKIIRKGSWFHIEITKRKIKVKVNWSDLGIKGKQTVRDLWRQKDLGTFDGSFEANVPEHGVVLVKITPAPINR